MVWPIMESRYVRRGSVGKSMKAVGLAVSQKGCWRKIALVLKKSPSWCLRGRQQQGYKQTRVSDAAGNRHSRRLAAYDGATRPFGVAVLLLPHRRSGSSKPLVTFHVSFDFVREKLRARTRAGERCWRGHPSARQGVDHRPGFDVPDQGKSRCRTGLLR